MKILNLILLVLLVNSGLIENDCVDNVKIGMAISDFFLTKDHIYSIYKETLNIEGDEYPVFNVYENTELIYTVEPDEKEEEIWRIRIYAARFKTASGIGIGNTLGDLRSKYTINYMSTEEGSVSLLVKEIDVSFELDTSKIPNEWWDERNLEKLENGLPITLIII